MVIEILLFKKYNLENWFKFQNYKKYQASHLIEEKTSISIRYNMSL